MRTLHGPHEALPGLRRSRDPIEPIGLGCVWAYTGGYALPQTPMTMLATRLIWLMPLLTVPFVGPFLGPLVGAMAQEEQPRSGVSDSGISVGSPQGAEASEVEADPDAKRSDLIFGTDRQWLSFPVQLEVTRDYLEFLLVNPHGGVHESLFSTELDAQVIQTAVLAMGLKPGTNAQWRALMGDPLDLKGVGVQGQRKPGSVPARELYEVVVPTGDSLYLYAAWKEGDETFFFRVEDLVRDLDRGRTLRRHRLVFLGSYMLPPREGGLPRFAASMEGNLIHLAFFKKPSALFTTAVEECDKQANWLANSWLLPERGSAMRLVFSKTPLLEAPQSVRQALPTLPAQQSEPAQEE